MNTKDVTVVVYLSKLGTIKPEIVPNEYLCTWQYVYCIRRNSNMNKCLRKCTFRQSYPSNSCQFSWCNHEN